MLSTPFPPNSTVDTTLNSVIKQLKIKNSAKSLLLKFTEIDKRQWSTITLSNLSVTNLENIINIYAIVLKQSFRNDTQQSTVSLKTPRLKHEVLNKLQFIITYIVRNFLKNNSNGKVDATQYLYVTNYLIKHYNIKSTMISLKQQLFELLIDIHEATRPSNQVLVFFLQYLGFIPIPKYINKKIEG